MARREITVSVDVDAPVETVWGEVTDWESQGEWMLGTAVKVTRGDGTSVGSELAATTGVGPARASPTRWRSSAGIRRTGPPSATSDASCAGSGVFTVLERRTDDGREASTFTWSEQLDLPLGALGALGWPVVKPVFAWGCQALARRPGPPVRGELVAVSRR